MAENIIYKEVGELPVVRICMVREPSIYGHTEIHSAEDAVKLVAQELSDYDREAFGVIGLKTNGEPISFNLVSLGTLNSAPVCAREVFKSAILSNASRIIAIHNHPSGNLKPSPEDFETTRQLVLAGEILGIQVIDHIIVAGETGRIYSFASEGLIHKIKAEKSI